MRSRTIAILASLAIPVAVPAAAQSYRVAQPLGPVYPAPAADYGFAREFVSGTYMGAPLTRFPRPTHLVPTPWSYGTYGIPTVSGIPAAPTGQPSLTVISAQGGKTARLAADDGSAGFRVIEVRVPRR